MDMPWKYELYCVNMSLETNTIFIIKYNEQISSGYLLWENEEHIWDCWHGCDHGSRCGSWIPSGEDQSGEE